MRRLIIYIVWLILSINVISPSSNMHASDSENLTVILVLDNSGSMKNSDPENLRFSGAEIILNLLDSEDKFGLVLFSTQAEVLTDGLVSVGKTSPGTMLNFKELASLRADGYTDINAALQKTAELKSTNFSKDEKVVIVFLTDGKPEIQKPYAEYEKETLRLAIKLEVPIMAIALTQSSQTPFLNELVQVTNGNIVFAKDSSDLIGAFLQVLGKIKDRTVIGGQQYSSIGLLEIDEMLAPYVESVTFIMASSGTLPVQMLNPDGDMVDVEKLNFPGFTLVTLKNPVGGIYTFRSQGTGEMQVWGILRSHLRADIVTPSNIHPADTDMLIVVNLLEETAPGKFTKIIGKAIFTALITTPDGRQTSLDRFYDDGTNGDLTAYDGNYSRIFPDTDQIGTYQINVQGWKGVVAVKAEAPIHVVQFPKIIVDAPMSDVEIWGGAVELRVHLNGVRPSTAPPIYAKVIAPSGHMQEIEMVGGDPYTAKFTPVEDGEYQVNFATRDARYLGVAFQAEAKHSFQVTVIPFVKVTAGMVDLSASCLSTPQEVIATLVVNTNIDGILHLSTTEQWEVIPNEIKVVKGEQEIQISLSSVEELRAGSMDIILFMAGEDRTIIQPGNKLLLNVEIPGIGERCRVPIRLGGGLLVLALVGIAGMAQVRRSALPLSVSGTLRHWEISKSGRLVEIDLTAYHKNALVIGNATTCDVMINGVGLELEHALISAKKTVEGVEIYLEPFGEVHKGYSQQIAPFALRHGETFRMGNREFQYLSDRGE